MSLRQPGGIGKGGQQVFPFEIWIIGQDLLDGHARAKQLQNHLDWVAEPPQAGLPMADGRVNGDAIEQRGHSGELMGSSVVLPQPTRRDRADMSTTVKLYESSSRAGELRR